MKTLQEVLDYQSHQMHTDPAWKAAGFGPTTFTTVRNLVGNKPVSTDAVDAPANLDIDFKKKLMAFFDTLGEIILQDYPHDTSVFDVAKTQTKDGHRPADRMVGESADDFIRNLQALGDRPEGDVPAAGADEDPNMAATLKKNFFEMSGIDPNHPQAEEMWRAYQQYNIDRRGQNNEELLLVKAIEFINEAVVQETGRLYDALVSIRGLQRNVKIFYPSMGVASRQQLQESLNKVFTGAVVLKMSPARDPGRITNKSLVILENEARFYVVENVVYDAETETVLIFEKKKKETVEEKASGKKKKKQCSSMVKEAFENYRNRLVEEGNEEQEPFRG